MIGRRGLTGPIVHTNANHPYGPRSQLLRPAAKSSVPLHVVHVTVVARLEPSQQVLLVLRYFDIGNAKLAKTKGERSSTEFALGLVEVHCQRR